MFGFSDHNFGIAAKRPDVFRKGHEGNCYQDYFDYITLLKEEYKDRITILRGIEVRVWKNGQELPDDADVSYYDYALIECLDFPETVANGDLFGYAKRLGCPCGLAHTNMFMFIQSIGEYPETYFRKMAEADIFWELNINYDSLHGWQEYEYATRFFADKEQQDIVRGSGVKLSIGFDVHRVEEFLTGRIRNSCAMLKRLGLLMALPTRK